jgi:hypothetical protein
MTDIPLNTYIEWTDADRERGECPVPDGSDVTVWLSDKSVGRDRVPQDWRWDDCVTDLIIGYLVHSMPREPIVRWILVSDDDGPLWECWLQKEAAENCAKKYGGRVVKLVEVDDD